MVGHHHSIQQLNTIRLSMVNAVAQAWHIHLFQPRHPLLYPVNCQPSMAVMWAAIFRRVLIMEAIQHMQHAQVHRVQLIAM